MISIRIRNKIKYIQKAKKNKEDKVDEDYTPLCLAQMEVRCYCCGKPGGKSLDCRTKDKILKGAWEIKKSQQHVKLKNDDDKSASGSSLLSKRSEPAIVWAVLHCPFAQAVKNERTDDFFQPNIFPL